MIEALYPARQIAQVLDLDHGGTVSVTDPRMGSVRVRLERWDGNVTTLLLSLDAAMCLKACLCDAMPGWDAPVEYPDVRADEV